MSKWLVIHTPDGTTMIEDVVEAPDYTKAYLKVLYKSPDHYANGQICSGIVSVEPLTDQNNDKN